jgi:NADP-dependent 3-hydroxy acid dehydrogenase YdfG
MLTYHVFIFYLKKNQGASSGIGAATGVHFAKLGYRLAVCGRNTAALAETAAHCLEANDKLSADDVI